MSKVTRKIKVTIPKVIAYRYCIKPGYEIEWIPAGDSIRIVPAGSNHQRPMLDVATRLELFDQATERLRVLQAHIRPLPPGADRGWRREDLYEDRGRPR